MRAYCVPVALLLALIGCQRVSAGDEQAAEYDMVVRNHGSQDELCSKSREVADAYLRDRNEEQYSRWRLTAEEACMRARLQL